MDNETRLMMWFGILAILVCLASGKVVAEQVYIPSCYLHYINDVSDEGYFNQAMKYLNDSGYTTITIQEYGLMREGKIPVPAKPIIITFDDGKYNVIEQAYPIMKKYGFKGVIAYPVKALWFEPKMSYSNLTFLASEGWEIGSHGYEGYNVLTHSMFKNNLTAVYKELNDSKYEIYRNTGIMPEYYVFPENGADADRMKICLSIYKYCSSNVSMSDWNVLTLDQRTDLGLGRTYCEGDKKLNNTVNNMIMLKKRLASTFQGDFQTNKPVNMTIPIIQPLVNETNTTCPVCPVCSEPKVVSTFTLNGKLYKIIEG